MTKFFIISAVLIVFLSFNVIANEFYAAPNGHSSGTGDINNPWDLQTALNHPSVLHAGDTLWLRGGVYVGGFTSLLNGMPGNPIIVRQYEGERAIIDGADNYSIPLNVLGTWTWYWGFEVMSSNPNRNFNSVNPTSQVTGRISGIDSNAPNNKFINLIVHDNGVGFGIWRSASNTELYGNIIYNNGYDAEDRGHGHGIYAQSEGPIRKITNNIVFNQFGYGIHAYGSSNTKLENFYLDGNVAFNNGILSKSGMSRNILVGGGIEAINPVLRNNFAYVNPGLQGSVNVGYSAGCQNASVTNNYFAIDYYPLEMVKTATPTVLTCNGEATNNTLIGSNFYMVNSDFPQNNFVYSRPTSANKIFVLPNDYEIGRSTLIIYNWENSNVVNVKLSDTGLSNGDSFIVKDVQNYFGQEVIAGVYDGNDITLPMNNNQVSAPIGANAPPHTSKQFGVFVVLKNNSVAASTINTSTSSKQGDLNSDGIVNLQDILIISSQFDISNNLNATLNLALPYEIINIYDVMFIIRNWG